MGARVRPRRGSDDPDEPSWLRGWLFVLVHRGKPANASIWPMPAPSRR
jgi:hypothetical protein